jgi:hypothetical protein
MNQDPLTAVHIRNAVQHLIRRHVIQDEADGFSWIHLRRYVDQLLGRQTDVLAVAPEEGQSSHDLT